MYFLEPLCSGVYVCRFSQMSDGKWIKVQRARECMGKSWKCSWSLTAVDWRLIFWHMTLSGRFHWLLWSWCAALEVLYVRSSLVIYSLNTFTRFSMFFFPLKNLTIRVLVVALGLPPVVREETWLPMALGGSLTCHVKLYRLKIYVTVFRTEWSYNLVLIQEILFIHFNLKKS